MMSAIKNWAENLSVALGCNGELNDEILALGTQLINHGLTIRLAEPDDIGPLVEQLNLRLISLEGNNFSDATRRYVQEIIRPNCFLWIAYSEKEIVGMCQMHVQQRLDSEGPGAYIDDLNCFEVNVEKCLIDVARVCAKLQGCAYITNSLCRERLTRVEQPDFPF